MLEILIARHGPPEVLTPHETAAPHPGPREVRIAVHAVGVNFADILTRMGLYPGAPAPPLVPGFEVAGVVDAVGPDVHDLTPGQRVVALTRFGGYRSHVVVPAEQALALPDTVACTVAAAVPVNYLTAWLMLIHLGNLQPGDTVLVHSAGGGVGLAAIQIARWRGARVIGVASAWKHERLRDMGVATCIDPRTTDVVQEVLRATAGRGVDLALDPNGGASFRRSYRCLAPMGRLFVYGVASIAPGLRRRWRDILRSLWQMPRFHPLSLMNRNHGVIGVHVGRLWKDQQRLRTMFEEILKRVQAGVFVPRVDRTFPLEQAAQAHAYIQARKNFGKVVLTPETG